ncbi:MAG TPA: hypothetical protein VF911_01445, partial [Thermoanaerobaculia bacterium]
MQSEPAASAIACGSGSTRKSKLATSMECGGKAAAFYAWARVGKRRLSPPHSKLMFVLRLMWSAATA